jgi:hypothetical protein
MTRSVGYIPVSYEMSNFLSKSPIFKTRESTLTFSLICLEAVLVCFLEGFVVMNHLALVSNCNLTTAATGKYLDQKNKICCFLNRDYLTLLTYSRCQHV